VSRPATARLAWCIWLVAAFLLAACLTFALIDSDIDRGESDSAVVGLFFGFEILATFSVGALLAGRRPDNLIGWLLLGYGFISALAVAADGYAAHTLLAAPGSLPGGEVAAWMASFFIDSPAVIFGFFVFLFLLFPDGRLPSLFWHRAALLLIPVLVVLQALLVLKPGELPAFPIENQAGIALVEDLAVIEGPLFVVLLGFICASAISLVRRFSVRQANSVSSLSGWLLPSSSSLCPLPARPCGGRV
jgi:hypothetical protein